MNLQISFFREIENTFSFQPEARATSPQVVGRSVEKMAKFFGEDSTLIRQFLANLGCDQYTGLFEEAGMGMQEMKPSLRSS
jgi:hypothetical protein